jgi:hypothetical protein
MSEMCSVCGREKIAPQMIHPTMDMPRLARACRAGATLQAGGFDAECLRLGYERTLARADRYEAEFSACKALLIAAQQRGERAEAERAATEAETRKNNEQIQYACRRLAAAEQRASEARAALERAEEGLLAHGAPYVPVGVIRSWVDELRRALAALPVEPARPEQKEIKRDGDIPSAPNRGES